MEQAEMVALIRGGVTDQGGQWADFGAGTGNFTWALAELLGANASIITIDRDARAVATMRERARATPPLAAIEPRQGDVLRPGTLPPLDGLLMANLLHFIRDQPKLLEQVHRLLKPGGRLLLVEYEQAFPIPWVPFPMPYDRFAHLAEAAGFTHITRIGTRRSPSSGRVMYAACAAGDS